MPRLVAGETIIDLGDCHGIYRGKTEGGQYRFQLLDGSDRFGYYKKKDNLWKPINVKKLNAAELYEKGQLFINSYAFYIEDSNLVRGKIYNTNPLILIVRGMKIEKGIDDVFTFESVTGPESEREALLQALQGRRSILNPVQDEKNTDKPKMEKRATNIL